MAQRKVIVLVESSRAAGRDLLRGIARYAHHHGPWSFYWRPAGFEKTAPELQDLEPDDGNGRAFRTITLSERSVGGSSCP